MTFYRRAVGEEGFGGVAGVGETMIGGAVVGFGHAGGVEDRAFDHRPAHREDPIVGLGKWPRGEKKRGEGCVVGRKLGEIRLEKCDFLEFLRRGFDLLGDGGEASEAVCGGRKTVWSRARL